MAGPLSYRFTNGSIATMDAANPLVGEVVTVGDRIAWVGNRGDVPTEYRRAREIDLRGRLLLPAFSDAHTHFVMYALSLQRLDLQGTTSLGQARKRMTAFLKRETSGSGWVIGQGLDINAWGGKWPKRQDLDALVPNRPVAIFTHDHHSMWVNSLALKKAKITGATPNPEGGEIVRDSHGEPTGILKETADTAVWKAIPEPSDALMRRSVREAQTLAHTQGVAAIGDMGNPATLRVFESLRSGGHLAMRLWKSIPVEKLDEAISLGLTSGLGDEWIKLGAVKIFLDGALGSHTAWMLKPYVSEPKNVGMPQYSDDVFRGFVRRASSHGLSVCVHAIGDAAVRQAITIIAENRSRFPKRQPPRIEHVQIIDKDDIQKMADAGIVASMQPSHLLTDRDYADAAWGKRCRYAFAFRSFASRGVPMAFGSDVPIEPLCPLDGIGAAVHRAKPDDKRGSWYPMERLSVWEAVWGFTAGAAYAAGDSDWRGMIRPGMAADLVVLDRNVFTVDPRTISKAKVELTFVAGRPVYEKGT